MPGEASSSVSYAFQQNTGFLIGEGQNREIAKNQSWKWAFLLYYYPGDFRNGYTHLSDAVFINLGIVTQIGKMYLLFMAVSSSIWVG